MACPCCSPSPPPPPPPPTGCCPGGLPTTLHLTIPSGISCPCYCDGIHSYDVSIAPGTYPLTYNGGSWDYCDEDVGACALGQDYALGISFFCSTGGSTAQDFTCGVSVYAKNQCFQGAFLQSGYNNNPGEWTSAQCSPPFWQGTLTYLSVECGAGNVACNPLSITVTITT